MPAPAMSRTQNPTTMNTVPHSTRRTRAIMMRFGAARRAFQGARLLSTAPTRHRRRDPFPKPKQHVRLAALPPGQFRDTRTQAAGKAAAGGATTVGEDHDRLLWIDQPKRTE